VGFWENRKGSCLDWKDIIFSAKMCTLFC
jgi:hypothetical protein